MNSKNDRGAAPSGRPGTANTRSGRHIIALTLLLFFVFGCGAVPLRNQRKDPAAADGGYRYANIAPGGENTDSLMLLLTFSGGGTRAAAFSYGVLEKLRDTEIQWEGRRTRLLDEVDIISSVSGGSLTSAYYGMFGDRIFEDYQERVLYRNLQGSLIKRLFAFKSQAKLMAADYGRGELMAEEFSQTIFDDKTFSDLAARNRRPFLIINATDLSRGCRFAFTQYQFDLFRSDLGPYPLGYAVAASAAVPGLLTPITLENFRSSQGAQPPGAAKIPTTEDDAPVFTYNFAREHKSYRDPNRPYIHLIDGGVSDNLGLLPIVRMLNQLTREKGQSGRARIRKIVIITVNAKRTPRKDWDNDPASPGASKTLRVANSTPMASFSQSQVEYLRLLLEKLNAEQQIRDKIEAMFGEKFVNERLEELDLPDIDCRFIEVSFAGLEDPEERDLLNELPTSFYLAGEDVDRLREAAGKILDQQPEFQSLLLELAPGGTESSRAR